MMLRVLLTPVLLGGLAIAHSATPHSPSHIFADTVTARRDTVREYRGLYETGFEISWFHACDAAPGDDAWWVTLTNDALRQRDSLAKTLTGRPRAVFVRWRGTVSPKMPAGAGHMGRGSRYMLVTEIISLRASDEMGCTSA
ncbi:MAG TPA: hypothetical protein VF461_17195 [Gemmatimonadaceae bacterium]